jgi:hypothetical protein
VNAEDICDVVGRVIGKLQMESVGLLTKVYVVSAQKMDPTDGLGEIWVPAKESMHSEDPG